MDVLLAALVFDLFTALLPFLGARPFLHDVLRLAAQAVARSAAGVPLKPRAALMRGALAAVSLAALAAVAGRLFDEVPGAYHFYAGVLFLICGMGITRSAFLLRRVGVDLRGGDTASAAVRLSAYREETPADSPALARRAIELAAEWIETAFVGPLLWFFLLRAEGAALYIAFAVIRRAFGDALGNARYFGMVAYVFDAILAAPVRIGAGVGICFCAIFTPGAHPLEAVKVLWRQALRRGALSDAPLAALAGAVGVAVKSSRPGGGWIGADGRSAKAQPADVERTAFLSLVMALVAVAKISILMVLGF